MRRRASVAIALALALPLAFVAAVACSGENYRREAKPVDGPEHIAVPNDPAKTAAALARVERALRAPTARPTEVARLSRDQQNAYRALGAHPQWLDDVVDRLPADVQPIVTANAQAGRDLEELGGEGPPPRALPDWQIVSPLPAETLRAYYGEGEAASGIPWAYLASIHLVETRLGRIRGTSSAGAQGPMQFIPATWARYGQGDINDNHDAILAAARFLQDNGGPGDMNRALFRYNNSNLYVAAVESYAQLMLSDERAFLGYYGWQVYYATTDGAFVLPEGYPDDEAQRVTRSGD
jgi:hypothetical protein